MKHLLLLLSLQVLGYGALAQGTTISGVSRPNLLWAVPQVVPPMVTGRPVEWSANNFMNQRPAWVSFHYATGGITLYRYTYNAAGQLAFLVGTDSLSGQLQYRQNSTYNANNQLVGVTMERWENAPPAPPVTYTFTYAYDAHGNLTRNEANDGRQTNLFESSYTYDAAGTITSMVYYMQLGGQPRQPVGRITFALQNGRWQSSVQEEYDNGSWVLRRQVHRYNWRNWPLRRLNASRWTDYGGVTASEARDTVRFTTSGTDTVVFRTAQFLHPGGWQAATPYRGRFDAHGNFVASSSVLHQDSSEFRYSADHHLRYQWTRHEDYNPAPVVLLLSFYYAPGTVTAAAPAAAPLQLTLSPNPVSRHLLLTAPDLPAPGLPVELEVVNALGQVVARRQVRPQGRTLAETWDVQAWPAGLYVLRMRTAAGTTVQRFVKQ
ncbi:T9SS type A sorting domain-containing protein [Hymenobacter sp. 15J16-1T3B]|uniref:T9SS type A sorting domain-containing protein n=1 Tax=Hymenobacter sp. 15J16-1T3B TaxID=2886941 RepID=UPI001D1156A4|nr:T9SS type A sorting domain-containing protein [Hymenobacter sp. 15J16-1T3B]MCC3157486.1 T9SS type A sorting domain-containing protein [Hymenobacter sp. 15J16-1T3B]